MCRLTGGLRRRRAEDGDRRADAGLAGARVVEPPGAGVSPQRV